MINYQINNYISHSSITNAKTRLILTKKDGMLLHSILVTCRLHPDIIAITCITGIIPRP